MAKIDDEILASVLVEEKLFEKSEVWSFIDKVKRAEEEAKEPKEEGTRIAVEYVVAVLDPNGELPEEGLQGWIIQKRPDTTSAVSSEEETDEEGNTRYTCGWGDLDLESKLEKWGASLKQTPRFKAPLFKCLGDFFDHGTKSKAEEVGLKIRTKTPISIIGVNPDMPYFVEPGNAITDTVNFIQ